MIRSSSHLKHQHANARLSSPHPALKALPLQVIPEQAASGASENCRIRLTFSLLPVLSITVADFPDAPAAEDLDRPLELLGGDLASGEALPEDLLRRVPGGRRTLVPA